MANNITVLNSASTVVTMRTTDDGTGKEIAMSIPTNLLGTAMVGSAVMATSASVCIATDQASFTVAIGNIATVAIGNVGTVNIGNVSTVTAILSGAVPAGTNAIGTVSALQSGNWVIAAGTNAIGTVTALQGGNWVIAAGTNAIGTVSALQSGAWTVAISNAISLSIGSTSGATFLGVSSVSGAVAGVAIKASTGTLMGVNVYNSNTTYPVFLKVFNLSASVVTAGGISGGAAVPAFTLGIPPGDTRDVSLPIGTIFTNAISYAITKLVASTDTTSVTTNDLVGMITYF
jgi:hypothetical protein